MAGQPLEKHPVKMSKNGEPTEAKKAAKASKTSKTSKQAKKTSASARRSTRKDAATEQNDSGSESDEHVMICHDPKPGAQNEKLRTKSANSNDHESENTSSHDPERRSKSHGNSKDSSRRSKTSRNDPLSGPEKMTSKLSLQKNKTTELPKTFERAKSTSKANFAPEQNSSKDNSGGSPPLLWKEPRNISLWRRFQAI